MSGFFALSSNLLSLFASTILRTRLREKRKLVWRHIQFIARCSTFCSSCFKTGKKSRERYKKISILCLRQVVHYPSISFCGVWSDNNDRFGGEFKAASGGKMSEVRSSSASVSLNGNYPLQYTFFFLEQNTTRKVISTNSYDIYATFLTSCCVFTAILKRILASKEVRLWVWSFTLKTGKAR